MKQFRITALAENTTYRHNCLAQHGQSMLIECDGYKLLFDVGGVVGAVEHNLEQLGIRIEEVNDVVISHRHIDHVGALTSMLPEFRKQRLLLPSQLGEPHIKQHPEKYNFLRPNPDGGYDLAISKEDVLILRQYEYTTWVDTNGLKLYEDIYTTGCIGDTMMEQAVVIDQQELGLTVVLGCSHPGVETLVEKAKEATGNQKVRMIVGGMHYTDYSPDEIRERAKRLAELEVEYVLPSHCTTVLGGRILKEVLDDRVILSKTGSFGTGNSVVVGEDVEAKFV